MIDTKTPGSPGWHLARLAKRLGERRLDSRDAAGATLPGVDKLDAYYQGNPPLPQGAENMSETFRRFQRTARVNYAELAIEAVRERMRLLDFRTAAAGDDDGDVEARKIMDANGLEVEQAEVHRMMLSLGNGYVIVGPSSELTGCPVITAQDPRQVITTHDPENQRVVTSALNMFHDPDNALDVAYVYLPPADGERGARAWRATRRARVSTAGQRFTSSAWTWDEDAGGADGQELDVTRVPVVRFRNKRGVGEYEPHLDHLNRLNFQVFQMMVIAIHQAHRQRAVKGTFPKLDETGAEIDYDALFTSDPGAMWQLPSDAEFWESAQADLNGLLNVHKADVQAFAAVSRTPLFYITSDAADGSAAGASLQSESLVFKAEDRIARVKATWPDVMSLAFEWMGDTERANPQAMQAIMASPERRSLAERADAAMKAKATDVPWATRMADVFQYRPSEIARMRKEREDDLAAPDLQDPAPDAAA